MTKEIELTRGFVALVDDDWFPVLNEFSWCAAQCGTKVYPCWSYLVTQPRRMIKQLHMHRMITGNPVGLLVDHRDGNTMNNQRSNLRVASKAQNGMNRGLPKNNTSGFKGVCWNKSDRAWRAMMGIGGKRVQLGNFRNPEDAARAYDCAALEAFGEFALTNRMMGLLKG